MTQASPVQTARASEPFQPTAVRAERAVKIYGAGDTQVRALDGVDVAMPTGRWTAIMGPSGSGKSTLMHCLAGLDTLTSGRIIVGGVDLHALSDKQLTKLRREKIGFVFQSFNLVPTLTALENITLPSALGGRKPDKQWLDTVVQTVGLGNRLQHRPSELSGGQQPRVAVARALTRRPAVLFAGEPTGNLKSNRASFKRRRYTRPWRRVMAQTVVMVTHDPTAAAARRRRPVPCGRSHRRLDGAPTADRVLNRLSSFGACRNLLPTESRHVQAHLEDHVGAQAPPVRDGPRGRPRRGVPRRHPRAR
jgi:putative ABC transport system ATP-binding protein